MFLPNNIITRVAPTPSGYLHIGNVFNFILTWLIANKYHGKLILRIDDADALRCKDIYINNIFDTLNWLNIQYDEGPQNISDHQTNYSQQRKTALYKTYLHKLINNNDVYACNCTKKELTQNANAICKCYLTNIPLFTNNTCIRFKTNSNNNFIIWRKDNTPSYQLISAIEDELNGVNLIVRGSDLLYSMQMQLLLAEKLNFTQLKQTTFIHHSLINDAHNLKLSKSAGSLSIKYLQQKGVTATDILKRFCKWVQQPSDNIGRVQDLLNLNVPAIVKAVEITVPTPSVL